MVRFRWGAYAGVSAALAGGVVLKALHQRPNFYSAAVYLAQSSANLMILTNFVFLCACTLLLSLQKVLFGPLRPIEVEQLYEKAWFAVTETCLAMTIFRGEIGGWFLVMFFALLAGKVWGWIGEGRVEVLEQQPPASPRLFHTRLAVSLTLSVLYDSWMLEYLVKEVMRQARPDMMVMFGFEFAVLTILSTSTMARYAICLVDIMIVRRQKEKRVREIRVQRSTDAMTQFTEQQLADQTGSDGLSQDPAPEQTAAAASTASEGLLAAARAAAERPVDDAEVEVEGWEDKGRWIFYLDLTTDFLKLLVYLSFFFILLVFYGLPIHILRDVFLTCRSFVRRINDFRKYRNATRDMNAMYPDATAEEISREDTCIICREEMRPYAPPPPTAPGQRVPARDPVAERMRPKKLPCGHILHIACLRSWLERQQICPTCRRPVDPNHQANAAAGQAGVNAGGHPAALVPGQQGGAGQGQPGQQGADRQNHFRMLNLGPLRIGFGAGRGDLVEELGQRIHDQPPRNRPNANPNGAQQFGFGFGFGRPRNQARGNTASIHAQLGDVQQRLQREIDELRLTANELQVVRMLDAELNRLRTTRQQAQDGQQPQQTVPAGLPTLPTTQPFQHRPAQALSANSQQALLTSDSSDLPEGLTLPQGWTMLPLHRMDANGPAPHTSGSVSPYAYGSSTAAPNTQANTSTGTSPNPPPTQTSTPATTQAPPSASTSQPTYSPYPGMTLPGQVPQRTPTPPRQRPEAAAAPPTSMPTTTTNGMSPSSGTTALPTWGSNTAADSAPPTRVVNGEATPATNGDDVSPASSSSQEKGKWKAARVEDDVDGID